MSIVFIVDVVKSMFYRMGYIDVVEDSVFQFIELILYLLLVLVFLVVFLLLVFFFLFLVVFCDFILEFDEVEMLWLCELYEEEVGVMYFVIFIEIVK